MSCPLTESLSGASNEASILDRPCCSPRFQSVCCISLCSSLPAGGYSTDSSEKIGHSGECLLSSLTDADQITLGTKNPLV